MKRAHPIFSPFGIFFTVCMLVGLGAIYLLRGGLMFNPGYLTAQSQTETTLQGFESHAVFEAECQRCHAPLRSLQGELCLDCHTNIAQQINAQKGSHANFDTVMRCFECHPDHRGREFDPTAAALTNFDHSLARFSLRWHQVDYAAIPIQCEACHQIEGGFETPITRCVACHADYGPDFMTDHIFVFGSACLDCHDGLDRMTAFDHTQTGFLLDGRHTETACTACHQSGQFAETPTDCVACHSESERHLGLFSSDCAACHTPSGWVTVTWNGAPFDHLSLSGFSLEHHLRNYADQPMSCQSCHFHQSDQSIGFTGESCVTCHQQADAVFVLAHQQQFGAACLDCHDGTGRLTNFNHDEFFELDGRHSEINCADCHSNQVFAGTPQECVACHNEPQIHTGLFGLQCQNCHTTQAWVPATLTQHSFPINHGDGSPLTCETCHPSTYVEYTCYECHEHEPAEIEREHAEEGITGNELANCVSCHPTGLEEEVEND